MAYSFLQYAEDTADTTVYTFAAQNLGTAAADRHIIITASTRRADVSANLDSVTIGGVAATIVTQGFISGSGSTCGHTAIAIAAVPSGTTGDIVLTYAETVARCIIGVYRVTGLQSAIPTDARTVGQANPQAIINLPSNALVINVSSSGSIAYTDYTGVNKDYDVQTEASIQASAGSIEYDKYLSKGKFRSVISAGTEDIISAASWAYSAAPIPRQLRNPLQLYFDQNGGVQLPLDTDLNVGNNDSYTVVVWNASSILEGNTGSSTEKWFDWGGFTGSTGYAWAMRGPGSTRHQLTNAAFDGSNNPNADQVMRVSTDGKAHMQVMIRDRGTDTVRAYQDRGVLGEELADTTVDDISSTRQIIIGNRDMGGANSFMNLKGGFVGKFRLYTGVLTQQEIIDLYDGTEPDNTVLAKFDLNEGDGVVVTDDSSQANHSKITRAKWRKILQGNIIPNGDFESPPHAPSPVATSTSDRYINGFAAGSTSANTTSWKFGAVSSPGAGSAIFDSVEKHSGSYSMKLVCTVAATNGSTNGVPVTQVSAASPSITQIKQNFIKIKPNTTYNYSFWMKTDSVTSVNGKGVRVRFLTYGPLSSTSINATNTTPVSGTTDWTQYTGQFTTAANAFYLNTWFQFNDESGTAWLDDVEVIAETDDRGLASSRALATSRSLVT